MNGRPIPFGQQNPHLHKSVTLRCVFILVQLNKCVVVFGSVFQMGIKFMGGLPR